MPCCAIGPCGRRDSTLPGPGMKFLEGRWHCYLCYIMPRLFPNQPGRHHEGGRELSEAQAKRDGDPKLAAERARPMSRKSNRAGPNWVPPPRRV